MTTPATRLFETGNLLPLDGDQSLRPCCFRLPFVEMIVDHKSRLRHYHMARSRNVISIPHKHKALLLVGETGVGKTALVNTLANYYYGTQWNDEFRLIITAVEGEGRNGVIQNQSESQTTWITAYTLHWQPNCSFDYSLTLIDTPGYNDPRGVKCDTQITESLEKFFNLSSTNGGIDQIDGVCFVVLSSQHRLTSAQQYVFHSILSVFGKDIGQNILLMATHVDSNESNVAEAAKSGGIPFRECFKLNNSVLFIRNERRSREEGQNDDDDEICIGRIRWKQNAKAMEIFFRMLHTLEPKSLRLTKEVLRQRQRLHTILENHREEIAIGLTELVNLKKESDYLVRYSTNPNENTIATDEYIEFYKLDRIPLSKSEWATNCDFCQQTCHYPCTQAQEDLWACQAMNYHYYERVTVFLNLTSPRVTNCNICPKKCPSSSHTRVNFRYKHIIEKRSLNMDCIREKHQSEGEILSPERLDRHIDEESVKTRIKVYHLLKETNSIILSLNEISLEPQLKDVDKLIHAMIDEEVHSGSDGWKDRVDQLKRLLQHNELIQEIIFKFEKYATHSQVLSRQPRTRCDRKARTQNND